jgi:hypothetical protein
MREAERQAALRRRHLRRHELADDRVAAFAVQHFSRLQISLGHRDRVGAPSGCAAGRLPAQPHRRNRDADLEADEMPALVHAGVAA